MSLRQFSWFKLEGLEGLKGLERLESAVSNSVFIFLTIPEHWGKNVSMNLNNKAKNVGDNICLMDNPH